MSKRKAPPTNAQQGAAKRGKISKAAAKKLEVDQRRRLNARIPVAYRADVFDSTFCRRVTQLLDAIPEPQKGKKRAKAGDKTDGKDSRGSAKAGHKADGKDSKGSRGSAKARHKTDAKAKSKGSRASRPRSTRDNSRLGLSVRPCGDASDPLHGLVNELLQTLFVAYGLSPQLRPKPASDPKRHTPEQRAAMEREPELDEKGHFRPYVSYVLIQKYKAGTSIRRRHDASQQFIASFGAERMLRMGEGDDLNRDFKLASGSAVSFGAQTHELLAEPYLDDAHYSFTVFADPIPAMAVLASPIAVLVPKSRRPLAVKSLSTSSSASRPRTVL